MGASKADWLLELEAKLGIQVSQEALFQQALTHPSTNAAHYQRLEFLGDAVLDLLVAELLYQQYPESQEGELSQMRAGLVNKASLAEVARQLDLEPLLILGGAAKNKDTRGRNSILADVLEALLAAIYLQDGIDSCASVVRRLFATKLQSARAGLRKNAKTQLQEWLQARGMELPVYELLQTSGSAHNLQLQMSCSLPALDITTSARAGSRRAAEAQAAALVLEQCQQILP